MIEFQSTGTDRFGRWIDFTSFGELYRWYPSRPSLGFDRLGVIVGPDETVYDAIVFAEEVNDVDLDALALEAQIG